MARGDGLAEAVEYASGGVEELEVGGQRLRISQTDEADTIGTTIWAASRAQVALFAAGGRPRRLIQGRRLLELGAGCGLAGIGLGLLGAAEVTLTDIGQAVLANLRRNVGLNANAAEAAASAAAVAPCVYHVAELDWCEAARSLRLRPDGEAEGVEKKEQDSTEMGVSAFEKAADMLLALPCAMPPDVIVGSDLIYSEAAVDPLVGTLRACMGPRSIAWITNEDRNQTATALFLQELRKWFIVKRLKSSRRNKAAAGAEGAGTYTLFLRLRRTTGLGTGNGAEDDEDDEGGGEDT